MPAITVAGTGEGGRDCGQGVESSAFGHAGLAAGDVQQGAGNAGLDLTYL